MKPSEYRNIYLNEDEHYYYRVTHEFVLSWVAKVFTRQAKLTILDAGAGTGLLAKKLEKFGTVTAIDISKHSIQFAKKRGVEVKLASVEKLPFRTGKFDLIVCIDVLYHLRVKNDVKAVKEIYRVLKPGGILILRVPASNYLRSQHDEIVQTVRRYSKGELTEKLASCNFRPLLISYVNIILVPATIANKIMGLSGLFKHRSSVFTLPRLLNKLLFVMCKLEFFLIHYINIPCGQGIIAICRK